MQSVALVCAAAMLGSSVTGRAQTAPAQPTMKPTPVPPSAPEAATQPPPAAAPSTSPAMLGGLDLGTVLRQGSGPITADQAAERAAKTAPSVKRAQAAAAKAESGADFAMIGVWPRVDLEARYTRLSSYDIADVLPPSARQPAFLAMLPDPVLDLYTVSATVAYPVSDLFLQILPRHEAAARAADAARLSAKADAQTVALASRQAFYNYARARATLEVARSGLAQSEAQRRDVDSLVAAGTLARVESMRAAAVVAAAQVAVARAEGGVAVARTALRSLLHEEGEGEVGIAEDLTQPPPKLTESKEALLARALKSRSEVLALRTMVDVHEETRDANAADQYPKLSVVGNIELSNPNQRVAPYEDGFNPSWTVSGVLSWSPNDYAASRARMSQSGADREASYAELAALEDALRREVAEAYAAHEAASQAMSAALTGIAAAEESYRVRREQFRAGAAVATDVIDAETELRKARLELVNAAIDSRIARAQLDRAVER